MLEIRALKIILKQNQQQLLDGFNYILNDGDKTAIIGEEGNGKSTLLKYIFNPKLIEEYCEFSGQVIDGNLKIGYFEQQLSNDWNDYDVLSYFLKEDPQSEINFDRYNDIPEIESYISKFKLDKNLIDRSIRHLSGGEKVKIQLLKLLIYECDILLLDEPTNDLDVETLEWLEKFINEINKPIMYISHDETLLENTANTIIHIEQFKKQRKSKYSINKCSYNEYIEARFRSIEKQAQVAKSERTEFNEEKRTLQQIKQKVQRANPGRTNRMDSLLAQETKMENRVLTETPDVEEAINFKFDNINLPNSKVVLEFELDNLNIGNIKLSKNIKLEVVGPEHIAIIGHNGVGKTTLFKKIYDILKDRNDIIVGYMPQNYFDLLNKNDRALDYLLNNTKEKKEAEVRSLMSCMKFTRDEMISKIKDISGGQQAKLLILKLMIDECNVILLDEPTRNLSPLSNPIIRKVLNEYNGAIISISHDRKYLNEVCDSIYELSENGLQKIN